MQNNYIIISAIDWKTSWQTQHRIAKSLVDSGNKVLFLENTGLRNIKIELSVGFKLGENPQKVLMKLKKIYLYIRQLFFQLHIIK